MDNKLIYSLIQEFRPELSSKEIEKYSSELQKLSSKFDQLYSKYVCENKLGLLFDARYQINGKGESYIIKYYQCYFVKSLEEILKNNPQISLREAIDSMKKVVDVDYEHAINSMEEIIGPDYTPDIVLPDCKVIDTDNIITHHYEDVRDYESDNHYYSDGNNDIWY
ncbi:MAG: hypothetical protein PG978_000921 [Wolbachia endosymbiont of Ctenocephalides felis wCfeF]|nr:MAG: hypothetical protein PG978_000921 [Wolbachia endosymbiont of Ctenocephalides felis wCfeF]